MKPAPPASSAETTSSPDNCQPDKLRVHFSEMVEIEFYDANQSNSGVVGQRWYSPMEYSIFRSWAGQCVQKVRTVPQQQLLDAADIIGLERHLSFQLNQEYNHRHKAVIQSVLDEQRRQRILPTSDNIESLSRISQENSRWARENARVAGLFLEHDDISNVHVMHNFLKRASPAHDILIEQPSAKRRKTSSSPRNDADAVCSLL